MAMRQTADLGKLSPSMRDVVRRHANGEPVSAFRIVNDLFSNHPWYGGNRARQVRLDEAGSTDLRPVEQWVLLARQSYVEQLPELDGKLTILGLALHDSGLAAELERHGLLRPIAGEIEREERVPLARLLNPEALARWSDLAGPPAPVEKGAASNRMEMPEIGPTPAPPGAANSPEGRASLHTALRALADTPTATDHSLQFADYADALAEFIESPETRTPLTIGIDAAWGMGKTSLMYMVRERLDPGAVAERSAPPRRKRSGKFTRFRTVWFNAWKYDQEEALWAALALEILAQTRSRSTLRERLRTWLELNRERFDGSLFLQDFLASTVRPLFVLLLGTGLWLGSAAALGYDPRQWVALATAASVSAIYAAGKTAYRYLATPFDLNISRYIRTPNYEERIGFLSQFEEDFRRVVHVVTQRGKWPLVVFVDDLDRCAPTKAVEVIEAISTVLDTEHCIFIIGMDGDAVAASIEAKYKDLREHLHQDPGRLSLGERFLEKIIQISFRIPRAEKKVVDAFIERILVPDAQGSEPSGAETRVREAEHLIRAEQRGGRDLQAAAAEVEAHRGEEVSPEDVREAERRIDERSAAEAEQIRLAVVEAARHLDYNPRKIKRFVNTFRLQALIARKRGMLTDDAEVRLLARAVMIGTLWPDFVDAMLPDERFVDRLQEAHALQGELTRLQSLPTRQENDERPLQVKLATCLANPRLKRLMSAPELIRLLEEMGERDRRELLRYLSLARETAAAGATHAA